MKNKIMVVYVIINIILIGIIYNLSNPNEKMIGEKQLLKEMSLTDREQELDNEINELNNSATEYATYVQNCKAQIANAITEQGITTNETDSIDVVIENIEKLGSTGISGAGFTVVGTVSGGGTPSTRKTITYDVSSVYSKYAELPSNWFDYALSCSCSWSAMNPYNGNWNIIIQSVTYVPETGTLSLYFYGSNYYQNAWQDNGSPAYLNIPIIVPAE